MKKSIEEIGQLLKYEKLNAIPLLKLPKVEKRDIPSFINCPMYEKAKNKAEQTMERYQSKVDRCNEAIQESNRNIEEMKQRRARLDPGRGWLVNKENAQEVATYNDRLEQTRKMADKIEDANEKLNDLLDKHKDAIEEAKEKREELTLEALLVIDEDIVAVLDRCTKIVDKLDGSENPEDLIAAIDICLIELRIFAMFEDMIEDNAARKDCRERIAEVNQMFAALCANEQVFNYSANIYQRNLSLMQKNAEIYQQVVQALNSVDQDQLSTLTQSVNKVITEEINTTFHYKGVVDPTQLDEIIIQINKTIEALKQNIVRANDAATAAGDFAKAGVSANQQAETLLTSMKSNVEAMKDDILSRGHVLVHMVDEAVIDDFYHKDLRPAVTALRKHIIGAIGEEKLNDLITGDEDRFSLEKARNAIRQANLLQLQSGLDKIPGHIKKMTDLIEAAESDIRGASEVPKQNADALNAELKTKYILACFPVIGVRPAAGILGRVKAFESAFRSTNQIYRNLGNTLLAKNSKMTSIVMVLGALFGFGGTAAFFGLKLSHSIAVNVGVPGALLLLYAITVLLMILVGKRLRSFLGTSAGEQPNKRATKITVAVIIAVIGILAGYVVYNSREISLTIPNSVTVIGEGEFTRKKLINVDIPDSVTSIGNNAFKQNKLTGVKIPDSVTSIGDSAFSDNSLTSIAIGANVTLGSDTFGSGFEAAYSDNDMGAGTYIRSDTESREWSVWHGNFKYQNNNENITITDYNGTGGVVEIPAEINGKPVTAIMEHVFRQKNLTSVDIPGSIISIDNNEFRDNQLTSVNIGNGVISIGNNAFEGNRLTSVNIPDSVKSIGVSSFAGNPVTSVRIGANVTLGDVESAGILGSGTGFNGAYANNGRRAGTYTRPNVNSTAWTRK